MKWLVLVLCLFAFSAYSKPMAVATEGAVTIMLYDDPCQLKSLVSNLPGRATWTENGKTSEGCWGAAGAEAVFYWQIDKTVGRAPLQAFKPVNSI